MAITPFILSVAEIFKEEIKAGLKTTIEKHFNFWVYLKEGKLIKLSPNSSFTDIYNHTLYELSNNGKGKEIIRLFDLPDVRKAFDKQWYGNKKELLSLELDANWHNNKAVVDLKQMHFDFPKEINDFLTCFLNCANLTRTVTSVEDHHLIKEIHQNLKKFITYTFNGKTVEIPHRLTLIPKPELVIGREDKIRQVKQMLDDGMEAILINGIGGIGKTVVAYAFVHHFASEFNHIASIEVANSIPEAFTGNMQLIESLGLREEFKKIPSQEIMLTGFSIILNRLNNLEGKNLLVIDNANDYDDLLKQRKELKKLNMRVVFTTRASVDDHHVMIPVDELSPDEALALFTNHYPINEADKEPVRSLLKDLEYHTLLVELVAKAASKARIPVVELQQMVNEQFIHNERLNLSNVDTGEHGDAPDRHKHDHLESYIRMTFRKISELDEEEKKYLCYFALLPPEEHTEEQLLSFFEVEEKGRMVFSDIVDSLVHYGWITRKNIPNSFTLKMHSLILDTVIAELAPSALDCQPVIDSVEALLDFDQDKDNPIDKFLWIKYGAHILARIPGDASDSLCELQYSLGRIYELAAEYNKAKDLLENSLSSAIALYGNDHNNVARMKSELGIVVWYLGQYPHARDLHKDALRIYIKNLGEDHQYVATARSNLALVYQDLGDYEKARDLLEKALRSAVKNFGELHPNVAVSRSNLATVYRALGDYEKARDLLEKALRSAVKNFGELHPNVAVSRSNLATVYKDLGDYEKARDLLEKALISDVKNFGELHPNVSLRQSNLALVYQDLGDYEKAHDLLEKALRSDVKNFGELHPNVALRQSNLAMVHQDLGDYEKARDLLETALRSDVKNFGELHPNVALRKWNLGTVYIQVGDKNKAKELIGQAYDIFIKKLGKDHPHTKKCKGWLDSL